MTAGIVHEEHIRVFWLDSDPTSIAAPTVAQITAGEDITEYLVPEGLEINPTNNRVDDGTLLSKFVGQAMGTFGYAPRLMLKRKLADGSEAAWTLFGEHGVTGALVVFRDLAPGVAVAAAQKCEVYPGCETGAPELQNTAANATQRFGVPIAVSEQPELNAVVAA